MRRLGAHNPVTVHNGINADWWRRPDTFVRADGFSRIVFIGRLVHAKGVGDLLLAASCLAAEFPALRVSIIGDGPYRSTLERQVRALGLAHTIIFHGALDSRGIRDIVWQSDIAVNPSHCEGFPRSVLETAAAGLPAVATDAGGTREIVEDGVSGLLVKERDISALTAALARLLEDDPLRARMGAVAALRARRFSVESMVMTYEKNFASHTVL
jgi:glycosyltransferase involved in cell wall biosynthesis